MSEAMTAGGTVSVGGATMALVQLGAGTPGLPLVFAHGWGHSSLNFMALARNFERLDPCTVIDFPGFGRSPPPPGDWGTEDYADALAGWLKTLPDPPVWIGHSFGARVGLQMAARHPGLVRGLVLVAGAGLKRRRSLWQRVRLWTRVRAFKFAKLFVPEGPRRDRLRARFGSADYRNSGAMRTVFLKVANEDLTEVARKVDVPVLLVYGSLDTETPPEIGARLSQLIPNAELRVLDGYGHNDILDRGQHQVANEIRKFLGTFPGKLS